MFERDVKKESETNLDDEVLNSNATEDRKRLSLDYYVLLNTYLNSEFLDNVSRLDRLNLRSNGLESTEALERLAGVVIPKALTESIERYFYDQLPISIVRKSEVPVDFFESWRKSDEYFLKSCTFVPGPNEVLPLRKLPEDNLSLPSLDALKALEGQVEICIPGVHQSPSVLPKSFLSDANGEVVLSEWLETPLHQDYGVEWDMPKISRDVIQNFYDGQGFTMDGVSLSITRLTESDEYEVRISGAGQFPYHLLVHIGGSSKSRSDKSAGFFGEGGKIVPLVLLRSGVVSDYVQYSADWKLSFQIRENKLGRRKLHYRLEESEFTPGSSLLMRTKDAQFVQQLLESLRFFGASDHPELEHVVISNRAGRICVYESGSAGNLYIGGQRYEVSDGSLRGADERLWSGGLNRCSVWLSQSLRITGRDRLAFDLEMLRDTAIRPILRSATNEELVALLFTLSDEWHEGKDDERDPMPVFDVAIQELRRRNVITTFPENFQALPERNKKDSDLDIACAIKSQGFVPCKRQLGSLGMNRRLDSELLEHICIQKSTDAEAKKIAMLRLGSHILIDQLLSKVTVDSRSLLRTIDPNIPTGIYEVEQGYNTNVLAFNAGGVVLWSRGSLQNMNFSKALSIHLHELTHLVGEDKSRIFTLELSNWIALALDMIRDDVSVLNLVALDYLWQTVKE